MVFLKIRLCPLLVCHWKRNHGISCGRKPRWRSSWFTVATWTISIGSLKPMMIRKFMNIHFDLCNCCCKSKLNCQLRRHGEPAKFTGRLQLVEALFPGTRVREGQQQKLLVGRSRLVWWCSSIESCRWWVNLLITGYALSRETMRRLVDVGLNKRQCPQDFKGEEDDVTLSNQSRISKKN